jgi:RND family efflux transporter MFP subunit
MSIAVPQPVRFAPPAWLIAGAVALGIAASAGAQTRAPSDVRVPVITVGAGVADGPDLKLDGSIQPVRQATVAAQTPGNVLALLAKAGDRVKAGQPLARIDDRSASAGLAQSAAGVAQAEAALREARTELARTRELRAQGFVSQAALDSAANRMAGAEAGLAQAQAGRSQAALARGFAVLTAPFDGIVQATLVQVGDLAGAGRPIATVYAPGLQRAVVQIPASQTAGARAAARIEVQADDGRWIAPAQHTELPVTDTVSQTIEWRLDFSAADSAAFRPGQTVRVRFSGTATAAAALPSGSGAPGTPGASGPLQVPAGAVLQRGELTAVYVAQGEQFVLRAVRTGPLGSGPVTVWTGLKPGERIAQDAVRAGLAGARP